MFNERLHFFVCVWLYYVLIQLNKHVQPLKVSGKFGHELKRTDTYNLRSEHRERTRRSKDERYQCGSTLYCQGNSTSFESTRHFSCYCDTACYKIFSDCCPDYEQHCGPQKLDKNVKPNAWKCVELGVDDGNISGAVGVWMIGKCRKSWPSDEIKKKCEIPQSMISVDTIPVVSGKNYTYRNLHCAACHGVKKYTSWDIPVFARIMPPKDFDVRSKLAFIVQNGGNIKSVGPSSDQPRRYCAGKNFINYCTNTTHIDNNKCINGPVEVVRGGHEKEYYKNKACSSCNGRPGLTAWNKYPFSSRGKKVPLPEGFNILIILRKPQGMPSITVFGTCPEGTVFDNVLEFCRKGYKVTSKSKFFDEFLVAFWFGKSAIQRYITSTVLYNFKLALADKFAISADQVSAITFHKQDSKNEFVVVTFRLTLTPFQSLILADQHKSNINVTTGNTSFLLLLNSTTEKFTMFRKNYTFPVVKVASKQLACFKGRKIQSRDYRRDMKKIVVNSTGETFLLRGYTLIPEEGGNISLCPKLIFSDCNGSHVRLTPGTYKIFPNLTLYHNTTNSTFEFGEYFTSEILNRPNITSRHQSKRDLTIYICLPYSNAFNKTERNNGKSKTRFGLRIATLVGFTGSVICHILLLITYTLFKELRTVPGLNLMNLSFSMCLSQIIWLIGTTYFGGTVVCEGVAILEHYLHKVTFLAMSVISHHTCHVFSRPFVGRIVNRARSKFIKYSMIVWLIPSVFVMICVILDKTRAFAVDYGVKCWLGTTDSKLYLFLLPLAIMLLYNVSKFIQTAASLSRHYKNAQTIQRRTGKQNLITCAKLGTLVGFPWLFSFLGVMFSDVETFEYLFIVFVSLQGVCMAIVFLAKKRTVRLYKNWWKTRKNSVTVRPTTNPAFQMS